MSNDANEFFPLHKAVFCHANQRLTTLLKKGVDVNAQDVHGNTPLHLAAMLGNREAVNLLLANGASVRIKNHEGWNSLLEAVSYGDRKIITALYAAHRKESHEWLVSRKPHLCRVLESIGDFYLELKWDFHTWIPLLSKIMPSDICKIYKHGSSLRMDSTLVDFTDRSWVRGDISLLFNPTNGSASVVMDNKKGVYQKIKNKDSTGLDEGVNMLMSHDIVVAQMSTKPITFTPAMSGWIFKSKRSQDVAGMSADYYSVKGLRLVTRKRREHLSAEDVKKNKEFTQAFTSGKLLKVDADEEDIVEENDDGIVDEQENFPIPFRQSLAPPPKPTLTWQQYIQAPTQLIRLGRKRDEKTNVKEFKAMLAMSQDFPLEIGILLDMLEVISPLKHIEKLRMFCESQLPPGFPVQIEIPLIATISAQVTFQCFEWRDDFTDEQFQIPAGFREDAKHFPDL